MPVNIFTDLVTVLAVVQLFFFGFRVGRARSKYGLAAPAMAGHPIVERYIRVHLNTLEVIVIFLPMLWLCAKYWGDYISAGLGVVYLIGRMVYMVGYIQAVEKRGLGFALTILPVLVLVILVISGIVRTLF